MSRQQLSEEYRKCKKRKLGVDAPKPSKTVRKGRKARPTHANPRKKPNLAAQRNPAVQRNWRHVLNAWKIGKHLPDIHGSVFWETSKIENGGLVKYREKKIPASAQLPMTMRASSRAYKQYLTNKKSPVAFSNPTGTCTLVSPPDQGKNFAHIGLFYKNASQHEIRALWKKVATEIEKRLKLKKVIYVSTHGLGVPWLHVRICDFPKYYHLRGGL